ncbi:MAG: hypothetical protein HYY93_13845 [Planctomycetes bacterium]|nr:hypothetical protein [Planctomycetota bacterium]
MSDAGFLMRAVPMRITYDRAVQEVTGRAEEPIALSDGCPFVMVLQAVFDRYPALAGRFPPGVLGFTLNGKPPSPDARVKGGDHIHLLVPTPPQP